MGIESRMSRVPIEWRSAALVLAAGSLASCGGGGDDAGGGPPPPITVGDYLVYDTTQTFAVPAGTPAVNSRMTHTFTRIDTDGTRQRATTYGAVGRPFMVYTFNANAAVVSTQYSFSGSPVCTYTPPLQSAPPLPRSVGISWSQASTANCDSATTNQSGQVVARETITVPAGTFDTFRASRQSSYTSAFTTSSQVLTCWYEVDLGYVVRCDYTNTSTPAGGTAPNSVNTVSEVLSGLGGPTRSSVGNVLPRFQGQWRVSFAGSMSGSCSALTVTPGGTITGSCVPTAGTTFSVSGNVSANGAVALNLSTGGTLNGTLTTPYSGSGTWSDNGAAGTWAATHF